MIEWTTLAGFGPAKSCDAGVHLIAQDDERSRVFLLRSGVVKLVRFEADGHETIVRLCLPGELIGAAAVLGRQRSPFGAVTTTRCQMQSSDCDAFLRAVKADPEVSWQLHLAHCRELRELMSHVCELGALSSRDRLARLLRRLAAARDPESVPSASRPIKVRLPLKLGDVARLLAVTPEHLSRLLAQMRRDGTIRRDRGWIIVPDLERLPSRGEDAEWRAGA